MKYSKHNVLLHPYYGFINSPDLIQTTEQAGDYVCNEEGFQFASKHIVEYPYQRQDNEILVGIFGGSVAMMYAHYLMRKDYFSEYAGKKVRILNFACSAWKQPQQVTALSYWLSRGQIFDYVINIDGFNEAVNSFYNTQQNLSAHYPAWVIYEKVQEELEANKEPMETRFLLHHSKEFSAKSVANTWQDCSMMMKKLCSKYLHVLQPATFVGWKPDAGEFSWCEQPVKECYQIYKSVLPALSAMGARILDATYIPGTLEEVFSDKICHLTDSAMDYLTKQILNSGFLPRKKDEKPLEYIYPHF